MTAIAYTLEKAEQDLRNAYWRIRASRTTDWKWVNKARAIKDAMRLMGVKRHEINNAMYCLRSTNCKRCNWAAGGIPCWQISARRQAEAETKRIEDAA